MRNLLSRLLLVPLFFLTATLGFEAIAAPTPETPLVAEARELVDTYYGNGNLLKAAALLERAYAENPKDANVFIQAARITVMGGHIKFDEFKSGTFERYAALLDKALALDPDHPKAHILKAEVFYRQKRYADQLRELDLAKATGTNDPWLQIGYGVHYKATNAKIKWLEAYDSVIERGPGKTASERKAYIAALRALSGVTSGETYEVKLRKTAAIALKERYPTDAWTPHGYAEYFIDEQLFDDAIFYAREALKTMDFGAGRLTLAAALYGKAALLLATGAPPAEIEKLSSEAKKFRYSKETILHYLFVERGQGDTMNALAPSLYAVIP